MRRIAEAGASNSPGRAARAWRPPNRCGAPPAVFENGFGKRAAAELRSVLVKIARDPSLAIAGDAIAEKGLSHEQD